MKLTAQKTEISPIEDYISTDYNPLFDFGKHDMRKIVNLPLYDEFMDIFMNHEICNWQAKNFWEKINLSQTYGSYERRRQMYAGLKVLVKYNYLEIDFNSSTKRAYSYKERPRLEELRNKYKKHQLEKIFSTKKIELLSQIKEKENNINFI
ncbi:hypothetical protein [Acinetobacter baumannii]|uniref:hypothetical protein n=1 Tax=Acinetobacter baumannii TaxID=470 RepID=UPI00298D1204|nr:hypothetical protein [Acinetobacter baumannii]WNX65171.1 hypothetical protein RWV42_08940 [Acinetobacter baumannii]